MEASYIAYNEVGGFSKLFIDYIENQDALSKLYGNRPNLEGFKKQIAERTNFPHRSELVAILTEQNAHLPNSGKTLHNIRLLSSNDAYTITTGHQLNLFTGPLYFIYKIVSTIKLAKELSQAFPDKHFIPVYWMATEDHDFEEINHAYIGKKFITWPIQHFGATGRLDTKGIDETVRQYQAILGLSKHSQELSNWVESAYMNHDTLAEATRSFVHSLFQEYGLVIIDADHQKLKRQFLPYIKDEIKNLANERLVQNSSASLVSKGYHAQVTPRPINLFYIEGDLRNRIVLNGTDSYEILDRNISFTQSELLEHAEIFPERFSPNVILRPLYQEITLPNLAYIGGGAEIAYWLQLKSVFDRALIPFPVLVPRNSALIINENLDLKVRKMGLTYADLFQSSDRIKKDYVRAHSHNRLNLDDEVRELSSVFEKIKLRAHKIDPTLAPSTEAVKVRLQRAMNNLENKLIKAEKRNFSAALNHIDQIKDKVFPNDILQERIENFGFYYVQHGPTFVPNLVQAFRPLDFKFTILH